MKMKRRNSNAGEMALMNENIHNVWRIANMVARLFNEMAAMAYQSNAGEEMWRNGVSAAMSMAAPMSANERQTSGFKQCND